MKDKREILANLGLVMITIWAALQYIMLQYVPDSVTTFEFIGVTNFIGFVLLAAFKFGKLKKINGTILKKGAILAAELMGYNYFMILGGRNTDSVVVSSVVSMYFVFVVPVLLLMKKKVSFRSATSTLIAIISLLLLFSVDTDAMFSSKNVIYLFIADIFFAVYVVHVSDLGADEDSTTLTLTQMMFCFIFGLVGWFGEVGLGKATIGLPTDRNFWICVIFFSVLIRVLYGVIQMHCQKYVTPINASLIFSAEIIFTIISNPIVAKIMGTTYTKATIYQIVGSIFFVIAWLINDDTFMTRFGYNDMETRTYTDEDNKEQIENSISKKIINTVLVVSITSVIIVALISISSIKNVRTTAVSKSTQLGQDALDIGETTLLSEIEKELSSTVDDKATLTSSGLLAYEKDADLVATYAADLLSNPDMYVGKEVSYPIEENVGVWAMQRYIADESISYESLQVQNELLGNLEPVLASIAENNSNIATMYIATTDGLMIDYDPMSEYADLGVENYYDFRQSDWFTDGSKSENPFFTEAYQDSYGRGLCVTCVAPIYDSSNTFLGCVGFDILVNDLNESMVNDNIEEPNYALLINTDGDIIAGFDAEEGSEDTNNINDASLGLPLTEVADEILSGDEGILIVGEGDDRNYITYCKIDQMNWILCYVCPVEKIIEPINTLCDNIEDNTTQVANSVTDTIKKIIERTLVLFGAIVIAITSFVGVLSQKIVTPLKELEDDVLKISDGDLSLRTQVSTDDEIGSLARSFNQMTDSLQKHIEDLKEVTAKEERMGAELNIATDIQANMLPKTFPAFPDIKSLDIFASMNPAKEVGGDFYDFFQIDNTHIGLVIADVSGKGVPAALFMVISKTLLKTKLMAGGTPAKVLHDVNNQLCEGNDANLFCTAWAGILDVTTGQLVCASAGHEYPMVQGADGVFTMLNDPHGVPLACLEEMEYEEYTIQLEKGKALYVYTDGVAEAHNPNNELFETDRIIESLNNHANQTPEEIALAMKADVDKFANGAEQFDDITMLCVRYLG